MNTPVQRLIFGAAAALLSLCAQADPASYATPGVEAPEASFVAASSGQLVAYYTGFSGGNTNVIGARINGVDGPTGLNNHTSAYGQSFALGTVSAGQSIVFFIDTTDSSSTLRFYSDKALNADGKNHVWASTYVGDSSVSAGTHVAFEDLLNGGDFNYHDHSFVFQITAVPEPASWALLLGGVAGLAALRRRR